MLIEKNVECIQGAKLDVNIEQKKSDEDYRVEYEKWRNEPKPICPAGALCDDFPPTELLHAVNFEACKQTVTDLINNNLEKVF